MKHAHFLVEALVLGLAAQATPAHAFVFTTCGDVKVVWDDPFAFVQNTFSIAPGGQRESGFINAVNRWRGVGGMNDMVSISPFTNSGSTYTIGDDQNDAVVVNRSNIGGNNGLTTLIHDGCFLAGDMEWMEADVQIASDMNFGTPGETSVATDWGRATWIHEVGHAHGLSHAQGFNVMRALQPRPLVGGPGERVDALGDDAQGGRFLYPSGNTERNLYASAQRRNGSDTILQNNPGTVFSCTGGGGTITINSTVGNNGTVNVTQTERWWVNKSSSGHSGGTQLGQWNNSTFVANTAHTRLITLTMPPLTEGTWFLFHGVDVLGVAAESRENDNNVREALIIEVIKC